MTNETEVLKPEKTYSQKLSADGWGPFYLSWKAEDLQNPDKSMGTVGFWDAAGNKQIIILLPVSEWIRLLTPLAKKAIH